MSVRIPIPRMTPRPKLIELALEGAEWKGWYAAAETEIRQAAEILDVDPERFADLLSVFSPRVSVLRSIRWAIHYVRTREYMHDVTRSHKQAMSYYEGTGKIRGPKTGPFSRALMGDQDAIVLDGWMGVALGVDGKRWEVRAIWTVGARRIRDVADSLGWRNAEAQAAIWASTVKRERANVPLFPVLAEVRANPAEEFPV